MRFELRNNLPKEIFLNSTLILPVQFLRIDEEFHTIVRRIEKEPRNTEHLVTLGEYIRYINAKLLDEKSEQILECTRIATQLMGITQLSPEHHKAFSDSILWLERIKPTLRKSDNVSTGISSTLDTYYGQHVFLKCWKHHESLIIIGKRNIISQKMNTHAFFKRLK